MDYKFVRIPLRLQGRGLPISDGLGGVDRSGAGPEDWSEATARTMELTRPRVAPVGVYLTCLAGCVIPDDLEVRVRGLRRGAWEEDLLHGGEGMGPWNRLDIRKGLPGIETYADEEWTELGEEVSVEVSWRGGAAHGVQLELEVMVAQSDLMLLEQTCARMADGSRDVMCLVDPEIERCRDADGDFDMEALFSPDESGALLSRRPARLPMTCGSSSGPMVNLRVGRHGLSDVVVLQLEQIYWMRLMLLGLRATVHWSSGARLELSDLHVAGEASLLREGHAWLPAERFDDPRVLVGLRGHPEVQDGLMVQVLARASGSAGQEVCFSVDGVVALLIDNAIGVAGTLPASFPWAAGPRCAPPLPGRGRTVAASPGTARYLALPMGVPGEGYGESALLSGDGPVRVVADAVPWARLRMVGLRADVIEQADRCVVTVEHLRVGGGSIMTFGQEEIPVTSLHFGRPAWSSGLRDYPLLIAPNFVEAVLRVRGGSESLLLADVRLEAICLVEEDLWSAGIPARKLPPKADVALVREALRVVSWKPDGGAVEPADGEVRSEVHLGACSSGELARCAAVFPRAVSVEQIADWLERLAAHLRSRAAIDVAGEAE